MLSRFRKYTVKIYRILFLYPGWLNAIQLIHWVNKNDFYQSMSLRHYLAFKKLNGLLNVLNSNGFYPLASHGTLLGAMRNSSFAGRPADVDLVLLVENEESIAQLRNCIISCGYGIRENKNKYEIGKCIKAIGSGPNIDIMIPGFEKEFDDYLIFKKKNGKKYTYLKNDLSNPVTKKIYSIDILVPRNAESYLVAWYGADWIRPQKKRPMSN